MANSPDSPTSTLSIPAVPAEAWAAAILTIDLGAVVANWCLLRDCVAPADCAAVVKADAYGLGAARVAPALAAAGCRRFFVAMPDEAVALRAVLPEVEIACFGGLPAGAEAVFREHRIVPVLNHLGEIARWSAYARRTGGPLPAIVHLDTGMNRLGLGPDERADLAEQPERLVGIDVRCWISHLACADQPTHWLTAAQLGRFRLALAALPPAPASLANSAGIFRGRALRFDRVRPGAALYGVNPTPESANPMQGTIVLEGRILQVRAVDRPMTVGYGAAHFVARKGRIATISVGYADGYGRALSGRGHVFVAGRPAAVVGRVSMDLITADVTNIPDHLIQPGGLVELIGPHRPVDQIADEAGTIGYEILTSLGRRYHRRWLEPGTGAE